jgi:hypothetical protein
VLFLVSAWGLYSRACLGWRPTGRAGVVQRDGSRRSAINDSHSTFLDPSLSSPATRSCYPRLQRTPSRGALLAVPAAARTRVAAALIPPGLRRAPVPRRRAHLPSGVTAAASFPYYCVPCLRQFGSARPGSPRDRCKLQTGREVHSAYFDVLLDIFWLLD